MSPVIVLAILFVLMLAEMSVSRSNERALRARGAFEPPDDVYRTMAWAYPASFIAMGLEGVFIGPAPGAMLVLGVAVFVAAKAIKYWAIVSLGPRWTFRVLVAPHTHLVTRGPYAWLRHPNYIGVIGELIGVALIVWAPLSGLAATAWFAHLLRHRIAIEDRALGRDQPDQRGV